MIECSICKASNEDRSLYCMECGQRLMPKVPDPSATVNNLPTANAGFQQVNLTNSGRLHSPILDLGGHSAGKSARGQFGMDEEIPHTANRQNNISRNGLHSPLLDGRNQFVNPYPYSDEDDENEGKNKHST